VTVKVQVAVLAEVSVAVHVTVVAPDGNVDPDGGVHMTPLTPQLSVALGVGNVATPELPPHREPVTTMTSAGQAMVGDSVSLTVTKKLQLAALSAASPAKQFTAVVPFGKAEPDGGLQEKFTPGQLSAAVTV
jgi:hypothetical protein